MPRRKPKVIRHITSEADSESEELPEVNLEPEANNDENVPENDIEEEQMEDVAEENEEDKKETNGEAAEEEASEAAEEEKQEDEDDDVTLVNGDGVKITTDEKGNEVLPDGTLIIQPEEVSSEADSFSGPEFKKKKTTAPTDLDGTYKCTSCHEQLNHNNIKNVAKHSLLGVLLCKTCFKYLESGTFDIDDEGSEEQCTWCGEGGKLICCDSCPKAFCRSCIKTNLGRAELSNILADEDEKWLCYVCNPAPLAELKEECETVFYHLKNQKKEVKKPKGGKNKKKEEDGVDNIMKVMQLLGDKSSSKNLLDNLVKGRSPKGLKKTLDFFKGIKKISEDLEKQIKNQLDDEDEEEEEEEAEGTVEDKSSAESEVEKKKDKKSSKPSTKKEESDSEKAKKGKKEEESGSEDQDDDDEEDDKKSKQAKKSSKDKKDNKKKKKTAESSPSEDDVPGTSSGSVKGNKSNRKGRRSLFKAQQKEKDSSSSDESDESSEAESSDDDSDWEAPEKGRRRRGSKKGKAGGKLSAKKGKAESGSEDESEDGSGDAKKEKKKKKKKSGDSDPDIDFPKKKKKKKEADNEEGSAEEKKKKKKDQKKKKSEKSKDGDISLSSDYDVESEEEPSEEESSADEIMEKIKKAKQNASKGTAENKQDLESDVEDKIAERLLMEEVEEEDENNSGSDSSDSDLDDAKKKRDKSNKKRDRKRKKKSGSEDDGEDKKSKKKKKKKSSSADEENSEEESKKKKKKKGKKKESESEEDSDNDGNEKDTKSKKTSKKKKKKHHLLEVNISGSDSDKGKKKKKGRKKKKKKTVDDSDFMTSAESSSDSDSDVGKKRKGKKRGKDDSTDQDEFKDQRSYKKKKGKRRRIKEAASSGSDSGSGSDSEAKKKSGDESVKEASGSDGEQGDTPGKQRHNIRQVMKKSKLLKTTLEAERDEKERRARIQKRRDELYGDMTTPEKVLKRKELILEYDKKNEKVLVEVDKQIVKHLKPHQVEGVQFIWEATFESLEKKDEPGGGGILAHCMGLGKTLQVITYLHTVMTNEKLNVKTAIVVCPLNTVLNWVEEFNKWLSHDDSIDVYEITSVKNNESRADMLEQWHEEGGVLVMGYSMYRILALTKFKKKRLKRIFYDTLVDPGPDVVVCDEGHMLKNSATAIAKALNSVKTRRRVCLTGTPLQNNLIEYHCMVDFVKPNLLGSQKEYKNRFVNPITNGQCSDSTSRDVRIMKHRAHILHDLLAGCVQRKDYSVIVKFLPPKHEYVLSIRLSPMQIKLYEVYLGQYSGMKRDEDGPATQQRSASIFADYQALMRIWTHPQVLKLNTIREENKAFNDMNDFVTSEEDSSGSSIDDFLDDRDSSDLEEVKPVKLDPSNQSRATRASRRQAATTAAKPAPTRRRKGNKIDDSDDSDEEGNKSDSSLEIIKSWKTNSRTLDPENDDIRRRSPTPVLKPKEWYDEYFDHEKQAYHIELSGKLVLLFEILKHCETVGEKILVFSQSLLSLDLIEDFLEHLNNQAEEERDNGEQDLDNQIGGKGAWIKGEDYFRMDGSTSAAYRQRWCEIFNEEENMRARLFLISTKAGSLGVNLVGANRVIIFDASWNPSHDTQSIFRVYRFGQERPVFIYRFVAQGTMEEKIYERQIAKQSLSQRVVDEHQIERHFTAGQLQELYTFTPDRLDDPDRKEVPIPKLPKDHILAELLEDQKDWIVKYHEHDSLLENKIEEELSEEERKAAWEEYNKEKEGRYSYMQGRMTMNTASWMQHYGMQQQQGATPMMLQKLYEEGSNVLQAGQSLLGQQLQPQQYRTISINGTTYRVPITQHDQTLLMRQYQALQQQRQRNLQMMPSEVAGAQSVSQLLANQRASSYNSMSNLLSRMSQQQQPPQPRPQTTPVMAVNVSKQPMFVKKPAAEQQNGAK